MTGSFSYLFTKSRALTKSRGTCWQEGSWRERLWVTARVLGWGVGEKEWGFLRLPSATQHFARMAAYQAARKAGVGVHLLIRIIWLDLCRDFILVGNVDAAVSRLVHRTG